MSTSIPPPRSSGGNMKYAIIGILLLLGAGLAIYFGTRRPPSPVATTQPTTTEQDAGPPEHIGPTIGAEIHLPEEPEDAGAQEQPTDAGRPRIRYVTRYIAACPGQVDADRVAAIVRQNYGGLRECYNRQLRTNPTLQGNVTAEWVINPNGTVGEISTTGPVARDRNFKACFEESLRRLRFPAPRGGCAMFQQRFVFTPGS